MVHWYTYSNKCCTDCRGTASFTSVPGEALVNGVDMQLIHYLAFLRLYYTDGAYRPRYGITARMVCRLGWWGGGHSLLLNTPPPAVPCCCRNNINTVPCCNISTACRRRPAVPGSPGSSLQSWCSCTAVMRSALVLLLGLAAACSGLQTTDRGYLLPLPRLLRAGSDGHCRHAFSLLNFPGPVRRLRLQFEQTDAPTPLPGSPPETRDFRLFSTAVDVTSDQPPTTFNCLSLPVPTNVTAHQARALLEVEDASGVLFREEHKVELEPYSLISMVATNKARYTPGQTVFFQLVTLGHDLRPVSPGHTHLVPEVWVTNPAGVRVAQWRDTPTSYGMLNLDFRLAAETPPGTWTIHIKTEYILLKKTFQVEEYVPHVFSFDVRTPKRIAIDQKTLTVDVCARYLFGKPLIAANVTTVLTEEPSWRRYDSPVVEPVKYAQTNSSGCVTIDRLIQQYRYGPPRQPLSLKVTVSDPATGDATSRQLTIDRDYNAAQLTLLRTTGVIQPKLEQFVRYRATWSDGSPVDNETVKICTRATYFHPKRTTETRITDGSMVDYSLRLPAEAQTKLPPAVVEELKAIPLVWQVTREHDQLSEECREVQTDTEGLANFSMTAIAEINHEISITASFSGARTSTLFHVVSSPSHSYLAVNVKRLPVELPCSGDIPLHLLTSLNGNIPPVQMQVMARGRVVTHDVSSESSPLELTLRMRPEMSPEIKLLVYTQLASGEVVSDSRVLKVQRCLPNKVELRWDTAAAQPGETVPLHITAAPNSICTVTITDASTELTGTEHLITEDLVMKSVDKLVLPAHFDAPHVNDDVYCQELEIKMFNILKKSGVSNADLAPLRSGFNHRYIGQHTETSFWTHHVDSRHVFDTAGFLVFANKGMDQRTCVKIEHRTVRRPIRRRRSPPAPSDVTPPPPQVLTRFDSSEQFLLRSVQTLSPRGSGTVYANIPGRVTSLVASAVCVHPQEGFGVSKKAKIEVSKLLFTKLTLPYSLKRGEVLNVSATVFNFYDSSLSVHLELAASDRYRLSDPAQPSGVDLCIASGRSEVIHLPLTFLALGKVRVKVTTRTTAGICSQPNTVSPRGDSVSRSVLVKPEGFPQKDTTSHFICLNPGVTRSVEVALPRPNGLIPGSERAYASVFGDMLGPSILHLDGMVSEPSGGGEPNMLKFVPNIHIHGYLLATGLMTQSLRQTTVNNMRSGYQRELQYRRANGSFSAYGNKDAEGSLWLTAFVIKSFKEASQFVEIDLDSTKLSAEWVMRHQQSDGCFHPVGELLHADIRGGVEREQIGALTAYVMLALHTVITNDKLTAGLNCLKSSVHQPDTNLYTEVLVAHAYIQLGLQAKGQRMVDALLKKATREGDDVLYWRSDRGSIYGGRTVADLEMTSYMTLSLLKLSGMEYMQTAAKAVKWIINKRNDFFKSPQATVVSLQALSAFSERTFRSDAQSRVSVAVGDAAPFWVTVNATNRLLLHQYRVRDLQLPSRVQFTVNQGCVTLQTSLRYSSSLQVPHPAFSLSVSSAERPSRYPGSSYELHVCTAYIGPAGQSQRAVLTVELPSGYAVVSSSLRTLRENGVVKSYTTEEDSVKFTVPEVTQQKTCLTFRVLREAEVEQLKPSVVTVHDFYEPERRSRLEYTV